MATLGRVVFSQGICVLMLALSSTYGTSLYKDPHCSDTRDGIVHLFEWRWNDIAKECEDFLGPYGFCAVQISPPNENRVITNPNRPWYERYQPVSYKLITRSGNETEFENMVKTCNDNGVRIYADVIINHMADATTTGFGTAGSKYDGVKRTFPAVPYSSLDFNGGAQCQSQNGLINDYQNSIEVRNCQLLKLLDLKLSSEYVRKAVAAYMNRLIDLGVAGFRMDSAKHMWPGDLKIIMDKVKDVQQGGKPFVYYEVIDLGKEPIKGKDYVDLGRVSNFKFGQSLAEVFRKKNAMKWLSSWGSDWGMLDSVDVVNFIDDHDNQRGSGGGGNVLTFKEPKLYKMATAFMLAHPYGMPRIMSSFKFDKASDGPPHNFADMRIKPVVLDGFECRDRWVCEHRWRQIYNMVAFRNVAQGTPLRNWWSGDDYQIAFSRGSSAFIAFNLKDSDLDQKLQTGLDSGTYCDVISGDLNAYNECTGFSIEVDRDGMADIHVCSACDDPMVAFHVGAKVGSHPLRFYESD